MSMSFSLFALWTWNILEVGSGRNFNWENSKHLILTRMKQIGCRLTITRPSDEGLVDQKVALIKIKCCRNPRKAGLSLEGGKINTFEYKLRCNEHAQISGNDFKIPKCLAYLNLLLHLLLHFHNRGPSGLLSWSHKSQRYWLAVAFAFWSCDQSAAAWLVCRMEAGTRVTAAASSAAGDLRSAALACSQHAALRVKLCTSVPRQFTFTSNSFFWFDFGSCLSYLDVILIMKCFLWINSSNFSFKWTHSPRFVPSALCFLPWITSSRSFRLNGRQVYPDNSASEYEHADRNRGGKRETSSWIFFRKAISSCSVSMRLSRSSRARVAASTSCNSSLSWLETDQVVWCFDVSEVKPVTVFGVSNSMFLF